MISWSVTPTVIQYQQEPVVISASGFAPNEKVWLTVATPSDPSYKWELRANQLGQINEDIYLESGIGRYTFTPGGPCNTPNCHEWSPGELLVIAGVCPATESSPCAALQLHLSQPSVAIGEEVLVDITGYLKNQPVALYQLLAGQVVATYELVPTMESNYLTKALHLESPGNYSFFAAQGGCSTSVQALEVIGDRNSTITRLAADPCVGQVKVTPRFVIGQQGSAEIGALVVTVTNDSDETKVVTVGPLPLPAGFTSQLPVAILSEPIAARSGRDFHFYLQVTNPADHEVLMTLPIRPGDGSYLCAGASRSIIGGSAQLVVRAAAKPAGLQITSLNFSPSVIKGGGLVTLTMKVTNIGAAHISNLTLNGISAPAILSPQDISFAGVPLSPSQEYTFTKQFVASAVDGIALVTIPAGRVTGMAQGQLISNTAPISTSVTLKAQADPPPPEPAKVDLETTIVEFSAASIKPNTQFNAHAAWRNNGPEEAKGVTIRWQSPTKAAYTILSTAVTLQDSHGATALTAGLVIDHETNSIYYSPVNLEQGATIHFNLTLKSTSAQGDYLIQGLIEGNSGMVESAHGNNRRDGHLLVAE